MNYDPVKKDIQANTKAIWDLSEKVDENEQFKTPDITGVDQVPPRNSHGGHEC